MSEIYFDISLLLADESKAQSLSVALNEKQDVADGELIRLVNAVCDVNLESHGYEYNLDSLKTFRNEIQINCYSGRSSETPLQIVAPLCDFGVGIIQISTIYEEGEIENRFFVDGKKAKKGEYNKQFKKTRLEDDTDKLQRFLSNENFSKAQKIVNDCDLTRISPEDEYLFRLLCSSKYDELCIKLLKAGLFDLGTSDYNTPWICEVAQNGSTKLLTAFLDYGFDPYDTGDGDTTTFHHCLTGDGKYNVSNCELLLERYSDNLNTTTESGSPLWYGYSQASNIVGCVMFSSLGAKPIAPKGFYDELDTKEVVLKATKHRDIDKLLQCYQNEYYLDVLYVALRYRAFDIVLWLEELAPIDWTSSIAGKLKLNDPLDEALINFPLFEISLVFADGSGIDYRLLNHIIETVQGSNEIYTKLFVYICGLNHLPQSVELLRKLFELGASVNDEVTINLEDKTYPLYNALFKEAMENFDFLLGIEAKVPSSPYIDISPMKDHIKDYLEGEERKTALALLKKHGR